MNSEIWFDACGVETCLAGRPVMEELNLRLRIGESTTILGPNGSGKSTLVKLIDRNLYPVVKPNASLKLFGGTTVHLQDLRRRLGVVSSELESRLMPQISAFEAVLSSFFGATRLGRDQHPSANQVERGERLMLRLALDEISDKPFGHLSDGQRRRLMIARALIHEPQVLVLDEPSRALDLKACHQLMQTLRQLCQAGTTVVQVTHRIDTIIPEMERVLFLNGGQIVGDGAPAAMLTSAKLSALFDTPLRVVEANGYRQVLPDTLQ